MFGEVPPMPPPQIEIDALRRRLAGRTPSRVLRWLPARRAAVAIVLDAENRVLLTQRAARAGDRWSGHVSLPGGMYQADDDGLQATAVRETREEVGLDPARAELLGTLDEVRAVANGGLYPMSIAPFVFVLREPVTLAMGPEVASAFWLSLEIAASGALDDRLRYPIARVPFHFPCWRFEGHVIWGLTYDILRAVMHLARAR
jgi:8-oxo-dGTP pyrophosphatase MutT (NUDIX family)